MAQQVIPACPKIPYHWEMQQLCDASEYSMTVSKVPDTEDTIKFMLDTEEFTYIVDMFRVTLHLPVETLENVFVAPVNIQTIEAFMNRVGYQGMVIPDKFLTEEIRATNDFKEYETVFAGVDVPMNQLQPVVSTQGTHRSTPRAYRTPTISTASPQGKKKQIVGESSSPRKSHKITIRKKKQSITPIPLPVQEKLDEEEIEKMVKGEEDEESYASGFFDSMINDDVDDSGTRIEPGSHKEHLENVNDDDEEIEKEMKDHEIEKEEKYDDVEKTDE
ncbi:hypothetical protein Tco_1046705, partial [Tanacetum coccineum]